jgi:hypothetical protein
MPASKWRRQSRGGLRVQQMAQIDADKRDYVSLAALRDGNGIPEAPSPALAILQDGLLAGARIGLAGSRVMPASEK